MTLSLIPSNTIVEEFVQVVRNLMAGFSTGKSATHYLKYVL